MKVRRGDVIYLQEDKMIPAKNHIQGGARPYVVVSNDKGNLYSEQCMIVPLTTNIYKRPLPTHTIISYNNSLCMCEQVFTISQNDVSKIKCTLSDKDMASISKCLMIALGC